MEPAPKRRQRANQVFGADIFHGSRCDGRGPAGLGTHKFAQEVIRDFPAKAIEDNVVDQTEAALREPESRLRRRPEDPRGTRRSGTVE
jgi:hypothetical protein